MAWENGAYLGTVHFGGVGVFLGCFGLGVCFFLVGGEGVRACSSCVRFLFFCLDCVSRGVSGSKVGEEEE